MAKSDRMSNSKQQCSEETSLNPDIHPGRNKMSPQTARKSRRVLLCLSSTVLASAVILFVAVTLVPLVKTTQKDAPKHIFASKSSNTEATKVEEDETCFCRLEGSIDDCMCNVNTVDYFNNMKVFPRLQSLLQKPYFRYFQYNPNKGCPFWDISIGKCASPNCNVKNCKEEDIPPGLKGDRSNGSNKFLNEQLCDEKEDDDIDHSVDGTISEADLEDLRQWLLHDQEEQNFCAIDAELCPGCEYVDLTLNPERFTGYNGEAAHRIWKAIYEENCFSPDNSQKSEFSAAFLQDKLQDMCLEKRAFYRAVSGLHSSITIHLCANYLQKKADSPFMAPQDKFGPNIEEFQRRFSPELTNGQGPYWLRNLYFVYLLELRALTKVAPYLEAQDFYTGKSEEDKDTLIAVKELLNIAKSFPDQFDETTMFNGGAQAQLLKAEFREHFMNISRVMDCVGCDKCKLWGKLQITGLGTALKILFSENDVEKWAKDLKVMHPPPPEPYTPAPFLDASRFELSRNEIVALFNAFGRISTSIQQLERFREKLK